MRLYEQDGDVPFDDDDFLGEATIKGVSGTLRFSRDDARYSLSYGPRPSTADYILKRGPNGSAAIERLDDRLRKSGVQKLLSKANRKLSRANCGKSDRAAVPAGSIVYCWKSGDDKTSEWYLQSVTTTSDANATSAGAQARADRHVTPRSPKKGVRLSFVDPARKRCRNVLLVYPTGTMAKPNYRPIDSHAGGIAWYGNYLYVAETNRGVRVFDLRNIFDPGISKNGTTRSRKRIGLRGKTYYGAGIRYVLPQLTYLRQRGLRARELLRRGRPEALLGLAPPQPAAGHAHDRRVLQGGEGPDRALARARARSVQVARGARAVGQLLARRVRPGRHCVARHVLVHAQGRAPATAAKPRPARVRRVDRGRRAAQPRGRVDLKGPGGSVVPAVGEPPVDGRRACRRIGLYGMADSRCR